MQFSHRPVKREEVRAGHFWQGRHHPYRIAWQVLCQLFLWSRAICIRLGDNRPDCVWLACRYQQTFMSLYIGIMLYVVYGMWFIADPSDVGGFLMVVGDIALISSLVRPWRILSIRDKRSKLIDSDLMDRWGPRPGERVAAVEKIKKQQEQGARIQDPGPPGSWAIETNTSNVRLHKNRKKSPKQWANQRVGKRRKKKTTYNTPRWPFARLCPDANTRKKWRLLVSDEPAC